MNDNTEIEKLKKELADYKNRCRAMQERLEQFPKRSFVSMEVNGGKKGKWTVDTKIHIYPMDKVRRVNALNDVYRVLNSNLGINGSVVKEEI